MVKILHALFVLFFLMPGIESRSQAVISTQDELDQFADFSKLPLYRDGTVMHQVSTYDRTGGNDDGFSGKYSFIRRNPDSTLVIFEAKGPGVINRIWTPTPTEDTLDFYVDDSLFSIKYSDLFSGKIQPFIAPLCGSELGGNYCYYPILFQDSCKIISRGKKMQFHQIQWRTYPENTRIKRQGILPKYRFVPEALLPAKSLKIAPKQKAVAFESRTGGRINSFRFSPASAFAGREKEVWLRITYSGETTPAVDCPASDFFGFAFGKPSMQSWLLGTDRDTAYCHIPLPYDKGCTIELVNNGSRAINLTFAASVSSKRLTAAEGKLYTSYSRQRYNVNDGPHQLLDVKGKGHFIGMLLQVEGTAPGMTIFFEGDDSTVVDGQLAMHGTGSEDYFNGGWYAYPDRWDAAFSLPFHGSLDYDIPLCRTGAYRFYFSDKIPFNNNFYHSIEHGPQNNNVPAIYTSVSFYYGTNAPDQPKHLYQTKVFEPDTMMIYPHLTNFMVWDGITTKSIGAHNTGGLSFEYTITDESRLRLGLEGIPEGEYELFMDYDQIPSGAQVRILQRQTMIKDWITTYSAQNKRVEMEKIGNVQISPFTKTISFHFKTTATQNKFFLNRLILIKSK